VPLDNDHCAAVLVKKATTENVVFPVSDNY